MTKITGEYNGGWQCSLKHDSSQTVIFTDAPKDIGGQARSFSPTDLVAAALVSCIAITLGLFAQRKGWDLAGMRFEVTKEMADIPDRRIHRLPVHVWMPIDLPQDQRRACEQVAHTCPVHRSLHPGIESHINFHWPEK